MMGTRGTSSKERTASLWSSLVRGPDVSWDISDQLFHRALDPVLLVDREIGLLHRVVRADPDFRREADDLNRLLKHRVAGAG